MAIQLTTGLPGNGKTLYTIATVKELAEKENRVVYYHGIPELKISSWVHLEDPREWAKCPPGSIVIIDEAQKIFRNRSVSSNPPEFVQQLETHRHLGIDLVLITQHPSLIDPSVRRLAGRHLHVVRPLGMQHCVIHRFESVKDNVDKNRTGSSETRWAFDKRIYEYYKSAEVHTVKRSIPQKFKTFAIILVVFIALVIFAVWFIRTRFLHKQQDIPGAVAAVPAAGGQVAGVPSVQSAKSGPSVDPVQDAKDYVWKNTPRVANLPETAPKYDPLTVPVRVPVPAMCFQIGSVKDGKAVRCKCYSQQATPIDIDFNMCISIAQNGVFRDFDPEGQRAAADRQQASQEVLNNRPEAPMPAHQVQEGPRVSVLPGEPMGPARTEKAGPLEGYGPSPVIQNGPPNNRATRASRFAMATN